MQQIYRIYINEVIVIIARHVPANVTDYKLLDPENFNFNVFYKKIKDKKKKQVYLLLNKEPKEFFKSIRKNLQVIEAAGGLVRNEENKYLFIFRKGKWDLPKGKLDPGENAKRAAVREVEEECGITVTKRGKKICKTWHVYDMNAQTVIKKTSWYQMTAHGQPHLVPQLEEEITDAQWLAEGDFSQVRANTYPLILDVLGSVE